MKFFYLSISALVVASVVSLSLAGPVQHPEEISWEEFKVNFISFPNYLSYQLLKTIFFLFLQDNLRQKVQHCRGGGTSKGKL